MIIDIIQSGQDINDYYKHYNGRVCQRSTSVKLDVFEICKERQLCVQESLKSFLHFHFKKFYYNTTDKYKPVNN